MDHFLTRALLALVIGACAVAGAERRDVAPHGVYIRPSVVVQARAGVEPSGSSPVDAGNASVVGEHLDDLAYSTYLKIALHDHRLHDDEDVELADEDATGVKSISHRPFWTMNRSEERIKCLLKLTRDRLKMYVEDNGSDFSVATSYLLKNAIRVMNDASFLIDDDEACVMNGRPHYRSPAPPATVTYYVCTTTPSEQGIATSISTASPYCHVTTQTRCPDTMTSGCPMRTRTVCPTASSSWPSYPMPTTSVPTFQQGDAPHCRVSTLRRCPEGKTTNCQVRLRTICARPNKPTATPTVTATPVIVVTPQVDVDDVQCTLSTQTRCPDTMTTGCPVRIKTICPTVTAHSTSTVVPTPTSTLTALGDIQEAPCRVTTQTRCPDTMTTGCPVRIKTICPGPGPEIAPTAIFTTSFVTAVRPTEVVLPGCTLMTTVRCPDTMRSNCPTVTRTVCSAPDVVMPLTTTATPQFDGVGVGVACSVTTRTRCPDTVRFNCPVTTQTVCTSVGTSSVVTPTVGKVGPHCTLTTQTRCPDTMTVGCPVRTKTICSSPAVATPATPTVSFVQQDKPVAAATNCIVTTKTRCPDTMTTGCPVKTSTICSPNQGDPVVTTTSSSLPTIGLWFPLDTQDSTSTSSTAHVMPTTGVEGCHVTTQTRCPDTMTTGCPVRTKTLCPPGVTSTDHDVGVVPSSTACSISTQFVCMYGLTTNCPYIQHTVCPTSSSVVSTTAAAGQCSISTEFVCPDKVTTNCPYIQHEICSPSTSAPPMGAPAPGVFLEPSDPFEIVTSEPPAFVEPSISKPPAFIEPSTSKPPVFVEPSTSKPPVFVEPSTSKPPVFFEPSVSKPPAFVEPSVSKPPVFFEPSVSKPPVFFEPSVPKPPVVFEASTPTLGITTTFSLTITPSPPRPSTSTPTPLQPSVTRPTQAAPPSTSTPVIEAPAAHESTLCSLTTRTRCPDTQTTDCPTQVKTVCISIAVPSSVSRPLADQQRPRPSSVFVDWTVTTKTTSVYTQNRPLADTQRPRPTSVVSTWTLSSVTSLFTHVSRPDVQVGVTVVRPPRPPKPPGQQPPPGPKPEPNPNRLAILAQKVDKLIEMIRLLILKLRTDLQTGQLRSQYHYDAIQQPLEEIKQLQKILNHPKELTKDFMKFTYQQSLKIERDLKKQQLALTKILNDTEGMAAQANPSGDATELTEQLQRLQASLLQLKPPQTPQVTKRNAKPGRRRSR